MKEQKDQEESERKDRKEQGNPRWNGVDKKAEADIVSSLNQQEELKRVPACEGDWG